MTESFTVADVEFRVDEFELVAYVDGVEVGRSSLDVAVSDAQGLWHFVEVKAREVP